jgi:hypothetical protein
MTDVWYFVGGSLMVLGMCGAVAGKKPYTALFTIVGWFITLGVLIYQSS